MFSTNPENAADIEAIRNLLLELPIGQMISYAAISERLGRDPTERRWILQRALKEAETDCGGLFAVVRGEGIKRLPSSAVADAGLHPLQKIRRTARRGHDRLATVMVNDLDDSERHRLLAHRSMLGAISAISDGRRAPTIAKEVSTVGHAVPAGRVLDLLKGNAD
jgi:alkylated DNA nucleotide flippase Atl1